ncbi:hypothetical protein phiLN6B_032 [Leuconostoc phage phiLN6B]|uniref:Uncharacterized protein n=2 Tax=Limdunavirus Lmd1 TaxID=2169978 RepID=A0A059PAD9_9CAUD|nr:hypothetical protein HL50_gp32 [Leuconostoc phage phiLN6B]AFY98321.1 hypothetical protein phiLN6B_032 [Leuconostoc phage phiLN6B]
MMQFDEMIEKLLNNEDYNNDGLSVDEAITLIEVLRFEYGPTVEITKKQYNTFKWHKDNLDFSACLATFQNYNGETRMGLKFDDLKGNLSDEDIMQIWLHPETIKVVDE